MNLSKTSIASQSFNLHDSIANAGGKITPSDCTDYAQTLVEIGKLFSGKTMHVVGDVNVLDTFALGQTGDLTLKCYSNWVEGNAHRKYNCASLSNVDIVESLHTAESDANVLASDVVYASNADPSISEKD